MNATPAAVFVAVLVLTLAAIGVATAITAAWSFITTRDVVELDDEADRLASLEVIVNTRRNT